jgi:hypothetical protein
VVAKRKEKKEKKEKVYLAPTRGLTRRVVD